ncbi:MAG: ASKHA domain-containing protein [Chloroflexi bacterium]|nr:ASKHA domain-containing protein [Chloroflexota bacterium]
MFHIDFQPVGRRGVFGGEQSLLDCARELNVDLVSVCGGAGNCNRCKVQIVAGQATQLTDDEKSALRQDELDQGYRLACQAYPLSDLRLYVPPESLSAPQRTQVEGLEANVAPEPAVSKRTALLSAPTLDSPISDEFNLWASLGLPVGTIDFSLQQTFSRNLRDLNWNVSVALRGTELIALDAPDVQWLGFAVDIGTTKIAGYLVDMENGKTLASKGMMNPQISYGEDIVARIAAVNRNAENAVKLQRLLVEALNQLAADLCAEVGASPSQIVEAVAVGNTAIHHLFLRLPVSQLGLSPYVPAVQSAVAVKARELGLKAAPGAYVYLPPNIAGYVGADHVAMLLAAGVAKVEKTTLAIDIGTNTEICLNHRGRMTSVSCASGPAFEGAHIKFGMRAAPGAIEHIRLVNDRLEIQTIGGEPPVGVCGSGLLDAVAQLRLNNLLDKNGKMSEHPLIRGMGGAAEFVLAEREGREPIVLSQKDVRELQLAKAAIRLGIQALVQAEGIEESDIEQVVIAGAFGTFIDVESAIVIGMLPPLPRERFKQVGNAAGTGARLTLISQSQRAEAEEIARRAGYIELAAMPNFNRKFAEATYL